MNHDVRAEGEGLLQRRRKECVVSNYDGLACVCLFREPVDIDDAEQRIAGRLDPDHAGLLRERVGDRTVVRLIDERHAEVCLARECIEQAVGTAVAVVGRHKEVARPEQMREQRDCGHTGRCHYRAGATFEVGQRARQQITRRVAAARVIVLPLFAKCVEAERR